MKALTFRGKHKISFESVPDPSIQQSTDVIVKVKACAICGSDLHVYHENEKGIDHGTAMGHEFAGEIVEVGKKVVNLHKGDLVMSPFTTSCGNCFYCKSGLTSRCVHNQLFGWVEKGTGLQGGQSEYVRVPMAESTLVKIPAGISLKEGILLGDVLSTGFYCASQAGIKPSGTYVVIGCGPVGLMAILGAIEYGAEKVYAVDTVAARRSMAEQFGATSIDPTSTAPLDVIRNASEGRGADGVMEAVGSHSAVRLAFELVRPGGTVSSVGVCTDDYIAFSPVEAYNKNLTYRIGRCPARYMMDKLAPMVQNKKYNIESIFSHSLPLSEGVSAYDMFANRKDDCLKVLLIP
jgi:2-desacetyl-2-hydroxyethyl bacteriochlorophyllide A dehydrogenase